MDKVEAIRILKDFHDKSALFSVRTALDTIIPELKESEDERIRKEIINYFAKGKEYLSLCSIGKDDILAWLEKQGELVNSLSKGLDNAHERIDELIQKNNKLCIKLEQKPAWSEEDESYLNTTIAYLKDAKEFKKTAENCIDWLQTKTKNMRIK